MGIVVGDLANTKLTPEQFAMVTKEMIENTTEAAEYKSKVQKAMAAVADENEDVPAEDRVYIQALAEAFGLDK